MGEERGAILEEGAEAISEGRDKMRAIPEGREGLGSGLIPEGRVEMRVLPEGREGLGSGLIPEGGPPNGRLAVPGEWIAIPEGGPLPPRILVAEWKRTTGRTLKGPLVRICHFSGAWSRTPERRSTRIWLRC